MATATLHAADLYCGAGGTSTGIAQACKELKIGLELVAVNHWDVAIATHSINHPYAQHFCQSVDNLDPRKVVPGGRLQLLVASPECTHHSIARGGRPINDQFRTSAWHILRWAEALYIENILVENVKEFCNWGPLTAEGKPVKRMRGKTFLAFVDALRSLGYNVDYRVLNAADYGDPTTRERLFILARRQPKKVTWPKQSHSKEGGTDLFGKTKKWIPASAIIDWKLQGKSIFDRKKPLSDKTLARIAAGLKKFGGANAEPFLVMLYGTGKTKSVDDPVPTVTANGNHIGLCEPFVLQQQSGGAPRSTKKPLPTIATKGAVALVEPFIVPFFGERGGQGPRTHSVNDPLPTVTGQGAGGLVEPFIIPQFGERKPRSIERPLGTITTTSRGVGLVEPFIVQVNHGADSSPRGGADRRVHSKNDPVPTLTTKRHLALVDPYLVKYYGTAKAVPISQPLDTVTTKERFGLVVPDGYTLDIRFRMLQPHELASAMSMKNYKFTGTKDQQTKQIGNAVPVQLAKALIRELIK